MQGRQPVAAGGPAPFLNDLVLMSASSGDLGRRRREAVELLSPADRSRVATMPDTQADAFLTGRLLVGDALTRLLPGRTPTSARAPSGVWYLANRCGRCGANDHGAPRLHGLPALVSISYAADRAFVAVASSEEYSALGIDAERRGTRARTGIAPDESGSRGPSGADPICGSDFGVDLDRWTAIEAVVKADGRGLRVDPDDVEFGSPPHASVPRMVARIRSRVELGPEFRVLRPSESDLPHVGYAVAVAVREK